MAIRSIFKITRKTFLAPAAWLGYEELKNHTKTIGSVLSDLFSYDVATRTETFEEAKKRQGLTDEQLKEMAEGYRSYAWLFVFLAAIAFFYAFYLLFRYIAIFDWLLGMGVTSLFLTYAFQYDFWAFQIRERKLGMTFKDWKANILGEKKKHD